MVLEWCISVADIAALILLSKFNERTKKKEISKESPNIDFVTGKKLPYIMVGDEYYIDSETGAKLTSMSENYEED